MDRIYLELSRGTPTENRQLLVTGSAELLPELRALLASATAPVDDIRITQPAIEDNRPELAVTNDRA